MTYSGLHKCFDAAAPPVVPLAGCDAVMGYVGGSRATHVWDPKQWLPFGELAQFPCYVPDIQVSAIEQANDACDRAFALGWHPGRALVCDLETAEVPTWWGVWRGQVRSRGLVPVCYGSLSTVLANKAALNWVASWDARLDIDPRPKPGPGQSVEADQYATNPAYDLSMVTGWLFERGGTGPRRQP